MGKIILRFLMLVLAAVFTPAMNSHALDSNQLRDLRESVLMMCRGGTLSGRNSKLEVVANAQGKLVVLKGLGEAGADAKVQLSQAEWDGIQANATSENYATCVTTTLELLLKKM